MSFELTMRNWYLSGGSDRFCVTRVPISESERSASFADSEPISTSCFGEKKLMLWPAARSKRTPNTRRVMVRYCMDFWTEGEISRRRREVDARRPRLRSDYDFAERTFRPRPPPRQ